MGIGKDLEDSLYVVTVGPYSLSRQHHIVYVDYLNCKEGQLPLKFSLAIFERGNEGYNLRFIGDRPFIYNWSAEIDFITFASKCQKYMDGMFIIEQMKKEYDSLAENAS